MGAVRPDPANGPNPLLLLPGFQFHLNLSKDELSAVPFFINKPTARARATLEENLCRTASSSPGKCTVYYGHIFFDSRPLVALFDLCTVHIPPTPQNLALYCTRKQTLLCVLYLYLSSTMVFEASSEERVIDFQVAGFLLVAFFDYYELISPCPGGWVGA